MSGWVKLDNALSEVLARKAIARGVPQLSDRAFRLYISALCFCSKALSDGLVPAAKAKRLTDSANKRTVEELVALGLFEVTATGDYLIHDYLHYNPSREQVNSLKSDGAERVARYRARRRGEPLDVEVQMLARDGGACLCCGSTEDLVMDHVRPVRSGGITELENVQTLCRGCNSSKKGQIVDYRKETGRVTGYTSGAVTGDPRVRDRSGTRRTGSVVPIEAEENAGENGNSKPAETELQRATEDTLLIVDTLAEQIRQRDPKAKVKPRSELWLREARRLIELDGRTPAEILDVVRWLPTHQSGDFSWSGVILSMGKLREQFTQLTIAMSNDQKTGRRRQNNGRATEMKHGDMEAQNEQWAAWLREHMPDIPFAEDGQLHLGAWQALFRIGKPASELSVQEHGDHIRCSVAAREAEQPDAA